MNTPRFDTPVHAVLNVVGLLLWLAVIALVLVRHHRRRYATVWDLVAILLSASVSGVYLPLGPIAWFLFHGTTGLRGGAPLVPPRTDELVEPAGVNRS